MIFLFFSYILSIQICIPNKINNQSKNSFVWARFWYNGVPWNYLLQLKFCGLLLGKDTTHKNKISFDKQECMKDEQANWWVDKYMVWKVLTFFVVGEYSHDHTWEMLYHSVRGIDCCTLSQFISWKFTQSYLQKQSWQKRWDNLVYKMCI